MKRLLLRTMLGGFIAGVILGGCASSVDPSSDSEAASLSARAVKAAAISTHGGMGATLYSGGVAFRVWAPFASRVWVAGDFNGWSTTANELAGEGNGNFSADVGGASRWQKYKYFIKASDGSTFWKADPRSARMENSSGSSIIHDPGAYFWNSGFTAPGKNEQVIYEMHVGTFNTHGGVGNFRAATEKLDYLAGLGVNMLEVMPVAEFAGDYSWGYNPAEPMAPESAYGTPEDMKAFVDGAHARGMGVIVDIVMNHWGPSDLPMWCFDGQCLGNGGEYFYTDGRASTPWSNTRPDYGRQQVRDYIKDASMMWLNEYRVDGLRWDATKYIRTSDGSSSLPDGYSLLQWVNDTVHGSQPWKVMIAEDFGAGDAVTRGTGSGGLGFDSQWESAFVHPIRDAVIQQSDASRSMTSVRDAIAHAYNGQSTQRVIYTESHDEVANGQARVPEMIWPGNAGSWASKKRSTLAAAITFTSPGVPLIFEGQEFLEDGFFAAEDPIDWAKSSTFGGITNMYRDLAHLRRNWNNNTRGLRGDHVNVFHVNDTDKVIGYHRYDAGGPGDDVVVVANFANHYYPTYATGFPRGGTWHVRFNSDWNGYSGDFGNTQTFDLTANGGAMNGLGQSGSFALGPYSVVVFSQ